MYAFFSFSGERRCHLVIVTKLKKRMVREQSAFGCLPGILQNNAA